MTDYSLTRRHVLVGSAVGIAAAASGAAVAQDGTAASRPAKPLQDPRTKYTREPFKEQRQEWPALTSRMEPRPDHGETSYHGSGRLTGRKALITGGDSGIGRAVAIAFAREGADVAINYHPDEESDAQEVVKLIVAAGRKAITLPADIRSQAACEEVVSKAFEQLGGLDLLVNNAAYQQSKADILEITDEQFDRTFKTNVYHVFRFSKAAIPHLPPGASIINTVSVNSYDPGEELIDYASTKAAILNLTKGMAKQLARKGIRVNAVAPGPVWTPLQVAGGQLEGQMKAFGQDTPLGRAGQPAELASLYVALAEEDASFSTGTVVGAFGGKGMP